MITPKNFEAEVEGIKMRSNKNDAVVWAVLLVAKVLNEICYELVDIRSIMRDRR